MYENMNQKPISTQNSSTSHLQNYSDIPLDQRSAALLEKFFRAMQIEFGSRWTAQFQTRQIMADAQREWLSKLSDLTGDEIRAGLDAMEVGPDAWPPGPRAFAKLAKAVSPKDRATYTEAEPEVSCRTPDQVAKFEQFRAEMRKIFPNFSETKQREKWRDDIRSGKCRANMPYETWVEFHG